MACFSKESSFDASEFRVLAAMNLGALWSCIYVVYEWSERLIQM